HLGRADEDVPDAHGLRLQGGRDRRHHADRPAEATALRPQARDERAARRGGRRVHAVLVEGRRAPPARPAHRAGLREGRARVIVTVQIATRRAGVPHARSFARWANAALAGAGVRRLQESAELTIRVVGAAESRKLNRTWRGKDKPTNVLSFQGEIGDLAICAPVVSREAREQGKAPAAHWAHMVVHGVLHLLGYDHENDRDAERMEARETKILAQL